MLEQGITEFESEGNMSTKREWDDDKNDLRQLYRKEKNRTIEALKESPVNACEADSMAHGDALVSIANFGYDLAVRELAERLAFDTSVLAYEFCTLLNKDHKVGCQCAQLKAFAKYLEDRNPLAAQIEVLTAKVDWYTVVESVPVCNTPVLIYGNTKGHETSVQSGYYEGEGIWRVDNGYRVKQITHWMPLPEAPLEVSNATNN